MVVSILNFKHPPYLSYDSYLFSPSFEIYSIRMPIVFHPVLTYNTNSF